MAPSFAISIETAKAHKACYTLMKLSNVGEPIVLGLKILQEDIPLEFNIVHLLLFFVTWGHTIGVYVLRLISDALEPIPYCQK